MFAFYLVIGSIGSVFMDAFQYTHTNEINLKKNDNKKDQNKIYRINEIVENNFEIRIFNRERRIKRLY